MLERTHISEFDSQNMLSSIEILGKQIQDSWDKVKQLELPESYNTIDRVVWMGMGGSALGISAVKHLFLDSISVPVEIVNGYTLPGCVNENTLVVLSSYSGTTEEVLYAAQAVSEKTNKIYVITTGADLGELATQNEWPAYIFDPIHNPCGQPRMAVGYAIGSTLSLFARLGVIEVTDEEIMGSVAYAETLHARFGADADDSMAKQVATTVQEQIPLFMSSEHLVGITHVINNQTNENGKHFAVRYPIPELNHHLAEGVGHPTEAMKHMHVIMFESKLYHKRNQARYVATAEVLEKNNVTLDRIAIQGSNRLEQMLEVLVFGSYVSLYLAVLHGIDPSPIPFVDMFKERLKEL